MENVNVILRFEGDEKAPIMLTSSLLNRTEIMQQCDYLMNLLKFSKCEVWSVHDLSLWFVLETTK